MKTQFFQQDSQQQAVNLVVYFAGWGTPVSAVSHLTLPENHDLLICYDYQNLQLDFDFSPYRQIRLVAFSLGVWVANCVMQGVPLHSATAINGTGKPCDAAFGIPPEIFKGTLDGLDDANRAKFERRMCGDRAATATYQALPAQQPLADVHQELTALYQAIQQNPPSSPICWHFAVIGRQDRIFPAPHQTAYWQHFSPHTQLKMLDAAHYLLPHFERWDALWTA